MKKVIRLNEQDIEKLVKKIIKEDYKDSYPEAWGERKLGEKQPVHLEKGDDEYEIRLNKIRLKNSVTNLLDYGVEPDEIGKMVNYLITNF